MSTLSTGFTNAHFRHGQLHVYHAITSCFVTCLCVPTYGFFASVALNHSTCLYTVCYVHRPSLPTRTRAHDTPHRTTMSSKYILLVEDLSRSVGHCRWTARFLFPTLLTWHQPSRSARLTAPSFLNNKLLTRQTLLPNSSRVPRHGSSYSRLKCCVGRA